MHDYQRYTRSYWEENPEEQETISQEHLDRAKQGKGVWNQWAEGFVQWSEENSSDDGYISMDGLEIPDRFSFSGFLFPVETSFDNVKFNGYAYFSSTTFTGDADFRWTTFTGYASFSSTTFTGDADFRWTTFTGYASFSSTTFTGDADFSSTTFTGDADFRWTTFTGDASFISTTFSVDADFSSTTFSGDADFSSTTFSGDADFSSTTFSETASFRESIFNGSTDFGKSFFTGISDFTNAQFEKVINFDQTEFGTVPEFNFAGFKQPPHLANISIPFSEDGADVEKYRKLKQMAIQSNDHGNEVKFFGYETHAKYFRDETPWTEKVFIKGYSVLSDFGASIGRPIRALAIYLVILFALNLIQIQPDLEDCKQDSGLFRETVATYTLSEALPIVRLGKDQAEFTQACLFGESPQTLKHSLWRAIHLIPSAFLLFLFGLAVRNRFKIK